MLISIDYLIYKGPTRVFIPKSQGNQRQNIHIKKTLPLKRPNKGFHTCIYKVRGLKRVTNIKPIETTFKEAPLRDFTPVSMR